MIVYQADKKEFLLDHDDRDIEDLIHAKYQATTSRKVAYDGGIQLQPCAYLHNYLADGVIDAPHYQPYIERAPLFLKGDEDRRRLADRIIKNTYRTLMARGMKGCYVYATDPKLGEYLRARAREVG